MMPSNLPSSFASAAAGQNTNRDGRNGARTDGRGNTSGEWSRQGRSTNGTLTFRRSSTTPSNQSLSQINTESFQPPLTSTETEHVAQRYTREEMLAIFHSTPPTHVSNLYMPGWNPGHVNGSSTTTRGWGKPSESHVHPQEPDVCWDMSGSTLASNLQEMTAEERDLFSSDVNSAVKPLPQNKDGNHVGGGLLNGRKQSVSHGGSSNFSVTSPSSASRPGTRRRETTDTNPYSGSLTSPTSATRPPRDDVSSWFGRRNTDAKDSTFEEPEEDVTAKSTMLHFGGVIRPAASTSTAFGAASSIWPQSATSTPSVPGTGSFGNFALPGSSAIGDKRPGNPRGESRLAHLIPKDSSDSMAARSNEGSNASWRARPRTDTDPFGADDNLSGSAVLGGAQDTSPPPTRNQAFDTPVKGSASEFGMAGLNLGSQADNEHDLTPLSPSETNPYRSPPGERSDIDEIGDRSHGHGLGLGTVEGNAGFRAFTQGGFEGSDRSQTSSVGAKAHQPWGNLTGWPSSATPDRERAPFGAFGASLFGSVGGEIHSPSLGNLGGVFGPATTTGLAGSGSISRGSKLNSLFPAAMQAQMQSQDTESLADSIPDLRQVNPLGAIGRNAFGDHPRETESPMRAGRGAFAEMFASDASRAAATSESMQTGIPATSQAPAFGHSSVASFTGSRPTEPPERQMVMPDRMRWVYLDPQGQQQGPFTGLEMNDWYKANFFTPDLRVKRLEDADFEPLGQLIRRIGNSREPFLVPQIGIAHGPPTQNGPFAPNSGGVIQPPLVGAFPSFGRTLTAQEQNDLERRKQEEQFLMAQHREHVSNQQRMARMQGHPGLHHHSSAHSLQSQPSFGSITSPITMPPQAPIGSIAGGVGAFFGSHPTPQPTGPGLDIFRQDGISTAQRQQVAGLQGSDAAGALSQQPIGGLSLEVSFRARLPGTEELVEDTEGFRSRLQEFEQLRAQHEARAAQCQATAQVVSIEELHSTQSPMVQTAVVNQTSDEHAKKLGDNKHELEQVPTILNKQFQQAQSAAEAKMAGLPMPFPPPQSSTPLPAPAPQRVKSNLPEQYASNSRSETPDITPSSATTQPPPLAPWAKEPGAEAHRGPSLKEIQEAEAKRVAKAEEAAAAARRAAAEQETVRERERAAAIASGLPTTSTWGAASPVSLPANNSPWVKPAVSKGPAPGLMASTQASDKKKTLADIQREEEARKLKAKEIAIQTGTPSAAGKRYADLASKPNSMVPQAGANAAPTGAGWAMVGAGGKVKIPTGPAAQSRSVSGTTKTTTTTPVASAKPVAKSATTASARSEAMDEFNKWLQSQLTRGITGVPDINDFALMLMEMPLDVATIADIIYGNSKTMNGQHFAEEFIRRKKLADRGVMEKQSASIPAPTGNAGGWNEVAKKGAHKESNGSSSGDATPAGFKIVPGRNKKGKK